MWTVARGHMFTRKLISTAGEEGVPLSTGLATHCSLADSFGGRDRRGRRCVVRHAGKVSIEYG